MRVVFLMLFCFYSINAAAIENKFHRLSTEDGLSESNIDCIFQDNKGFLWIGTYNGLNRFDGYNLKTYFPDQKDSLSLSNGHITSIIEDKLGRLWIGTKEGINIYYPEYDHFKQIRSFNYRNTTYETTDIQTITIDSDSNIWVGCGYSGIVVFNTEFEVLDYFSHNPLSNKSLPQGRYGAILFTKNGQCWVGTQGGQISCYQSTSKLFKNYIYNDSLSNNIVVKTLFEDSDGNIWIGSDEGGACYFNPIEISFNYIKPTGGEYGLSHGQITSFCEDWDGNILIGTNGGGIDVFNPDTKKINHIQYDKYSPTSLSTNSIYELFIDRSNTIWIGTYSNGLNYTNLYQNKFTKYTPNPLDPNSLSYKNVTSIMEDTDGDIWVGTEGGGLNKFDVIKKKFTRYMADPNKKDWIPTNAIIHLAQARDGNIYIGTYGSGLIIYNKPDNTFKQYLPDPEDPNSLPGEHVWYIHQDIENKIWLGMRKTGIAIFDKETETFKHIKANVDDPNSLYSPSIQIIYEDKNNTTWVGTAGGGLHKYNRAKNNFTRYLHDPKVSTSLSSMHVVTLFEDSRNNFWVGTSNGLNKMDRKTGKFEVLTKENGLPDNVIKGILEDDDGFLWISTNNGIFQFDPDIDSIKCYNASDGLQGNEFNREAKLKTRSGMMLFGGKNEGLNVFDPKKILINTYIPNVVITDFKILNKSKLIPVYDGNKIVDYKSIQSVETIKLQPHENIINFEFSALDFANPGNNMYKYMLEGFDDDWIETNYEKRYVTYTNLNSGSYTFRVKASNSDGLWNEEGYSLNIYVIPPYWKKPWFIISLATLLIAVIVAVIRRREKRSRMDRRELRDKLHSSRHEVELQNLELVKKDKELQQLIENEKEQQWQHEGIEKLNDIISSQKENLETLAKEIVTELGGYIGIDLGAIYLIKKENNHKFLRLVAAYGPNSEELIGKKIEIGQGLVGASFIDQEKMINDNLPESYTRHLTKNNIPYTYQVIIPLTLNEITLGVFELISKDKIDTFKLDFIDKIAETLSSIVSSYEANDTTIKLMQQQQENTEELKMAQEMLKDNIEKLAVSEEESARKMEALLNRQLELKERKKKLKKDIKTLREKIKTLETDQ